MALTPTGYIAEKLLHLANPTFGKAVGATVLAAASVAGYNAWERAGAPVYSSAAPGSGKISRITITDGKYCNAEYDTVVTKAGAKMSKVTPFFVHETLEEDYTGTVRSEVCLVLKNVNIDLQKTGPNAGKYVLDLVVNNKPSSNVQITSYEANPTESVYAEKRNWAGNLDTLALAGMNIVPGTHVSSGETITQQVADLARLEGFNIGANQCGPTAVKYLVDGTHLGDKTIQGKFITDMNKVATQISGHAVNIGPSNVAVTLHTDGTGVYNNYTVLENTLMSRNPGLTFPVNNGPAPCEIITGVSAPTN